MSFFFFPGVWDRGIERVGSSAPVLSAGAQRHAPAARSGSLRGPASGASSVRHPGRLFIFVSPFCVYCPIHGQKMYTRTLFIFAKEHEERLVEEKMLADIECYLKPDSEWKVFSAGHRVLPCFSKLC